MMVVWTESLSPTFRTEMCSLKEFQVPLFRLPEANSFSCNQHNSLSFRQNRILFDLQKAANSQVIRLKKKRLH